jgi:DNA-binding transcriptional ArsR family regulator
MHLRLYKVMAYDRALAALAHPTRRRIYERMRRQDRTVGELASLARITQRPRRSTCGSSLPPV